MVSDDFFASFYDWLQNLCFLSNWGSLKRRVQRLFHPLQSDFPADGDETASGRRGMDQLFSFSTTGYFASQEKVKTSVAEQQPESHTFTYH